MWKNRSYMPVKSVAEQCVSLECANVLDVSNAERSDDLTKVVFRSEVLCLHLSTSSTDHVVGSNNSVTARCR